MNKPHVRRTVIATYLAGAIFLVAHSLNAFVENELIPVPSVDIQQTSSPDVAAAEIATSIQLAEQIKMSGLFSLPAQPPSLTADGTSAKTLKPALNLAQKIRLLGTVLDSRGGGYAMTEELPSKRQSLVRLHEAIENIGEVNEIRRDGIVIRLGDQEELVGLAILQEDPNQPPSAASANPALASPLPAKRTLDRREVQEAVSDPSKLLMQANAVPYLRNGVLQGFRLDFVNPGGFFDRAGFQYGDVIQRINGVEIRDPGRLLGMFNQVAKERTVKVDIVRATHNTTLTYELR